MAEVINVCFHGIGVPSQEREPGESRYWVTMQQYESILDEIAAWPSVRISFDDGNQSDVEFGLPGLIARGLTATFFPLAGRIGSVGSVDSQGIRDLSTAGMTIGSHGMDHRSWRGMDPVTTARELVEAREQIASLAGRQVDQVALPLGRYDRRVLNSLRKLGYEHVHTSDRRPARLGGWLQPRFSVRQEDTAQSLRSAVRWAKSPIGRARLQAIGVVKRFR